MNHSPSYHNPEFDEFAEDYDQSLDKGIRVSGESKEYFAKGRVDWAARTLQTFGFQPRRAMDFGCGTGAATPFLLELPGLQNLIGLEVSAKSIEVARRSHGSDRAEFRLSGEFQPTADIDFAFCNGVFHHIPPDERSNAVRFILDSLRPGGVFAFWENNPWNPGTRYVMSRIPFDRDAVKVSPLTAVSLLKDGGFEIIRTDFLFFFPRILRWFRTLEPMLCKAPLGAQYQVLARRPSTVR
jgi:SAM-dependent methyltransferase